jgi:PAS domain S-box-containing protein
MAENPETSERDAADFLYWRLIPVVVTAQAATAIGAVLALRANSASLEVVAVIASVGVVTVLCGAVFHVGRLLRRSEDRRRRLAEDLRLSHERFVLAVEGSTDGLWDWDIASNKVYFSPRYKSMLGYADSEIENSFASWEKLIHPDDLPVARKKVKDYHDGRVPVYELEHRLRQKDGTYRWILARGALLRGADGRPLRMSGSHTDINERKHLEEQLRAARDAALASDRAKSEFLANISHEMRTPLNAILGMCELMGAQPLPEPQASRAKLAHAAVGALTATVDDLLDLSKIEAGRLTLDPVPTDIRELFGTAFSLLVSQAHAKSVELKLDVADSVPPFLRADPLRLRQVVANLLHNALKFTEAGEVRLSASTEPIDDNGVFLNVSVRDTGIGIAPEAQPRLFQPFTQADASTTRRYGGTGLGLAICRRLVEAMGGVIGVESAPGAGALFWFRVPLPIAGEAPRAEPAPAAEPSLSRLRVLIVEDNPANRRIALEMLSHLGVAADVAENGKLGLERLSAFDYDLVFMDCSMPVMDGYEATREWRRREAPGARLPIVAMTAYALQGDKEKCLTVGMDDYLSKPVRLRDFAGALSRWAAPVDAEVLAKAAGLVGAAQGRWKLEFLEDARRQLAEMRGCKDAAALSRAAHTLRGSSASLGARRLSTLCARIESSGAAAPELLDDAARELELVAAALG